MAKRKLSMKPNVSATIAYLFGWISGIVIYLLEQQNRYVRVHAVQSILVSGLFTVVIGVVQLLLGWFFLGRFLAWILGLIFFAVWIMCMVRTATYKDFRIPLLGQIAEGIVD